MKRTFPKDTLRALHETPILEKLWLSWFGSGLNPIAPGTVGSLAAIPFLAVSNQIFLMPLARLLVALILVIFSSWVASRVVIRSRVNDAQWIVVDEVCGMALATLFWQPSFQDSALDSVLVEIALAFIFFRVFDVTKPFPIKMLDAASKTHASPYFRGTMIIVDDVAAGLYALLAVEITKVLISSF